LITDVAVRITPLTDVDAGEMVRSLKTFPLLDGYRGAAPCDVPAIEDVLLRVSAMVQAHPEIAELDCDPLIAGPRGATIVDALLGTGGLYSDAAGSIRPGLAVTGFPAANGTWQYTLNGGASWTPFGAVSPFAATLLRADGAGNTRVRFLPDPDVNGTTSFSFRAWDGLDGSANGANGVDTTAGGPYGAPPLARKRPDVGGVVDPSSAELLG